MERVLLPVAQLGKGPLHDGKLQIWAKLRFPFVARNVRAVVRGDDATGSRVISDERSGHGGSLELKNVDLRGCDDPVLNVKMELDRSAVANRNGVLCAPHAVRRRREELAVRTVGGPSRDIGGRVPLHVGLGRIVIHPRKRDSGIDTLSRRADEVEIGIGKGAREYTGGEPESVERLQ